MAARDPGGTPRPESTLDRAWGGVSLGRAGGAPGQGGHSLRNFFGVWCSVVLLLAGCRPRGLDPQPKTILAVFAHPDDEIFVGPLLAHYARRGARIHLVIVTDGEKGGSPRAGVPAGPELARVRAAEARCSCQELGIEAPELLGFKDGELGRLRNPPAGYLAEVP